MVVGENVVDSEGLGTRLHLRIFACVWEENKWAVLGDPVTNGIPPPRPPPRKHPPQIEKKKKSDYLITLRMLPALPVPPRQLTPGRRVVKTLPRRP